MNKVAVFVICLSLVFVKFATTKEKTISTVPTKTWVKIFHIARSLNANICVYEVGIDSTTCVFDISEPIKIYWIMYTKGGIREPLTVVEEKLAYGIKISTVTKHEIRFCLKSLPKKEIKVTFFLNGKRNPELVSRKEKPVLENELLLPKAVTEIDGEEAIIEKIFVQSKKTFPLPKVLYTEVTGKSIETGKIKSERISGQ